ncbi:endoplasmic reticulum resident protein 44-like [Chrysoperla carnea]|uniref:endoplasmic reticulum resident protein 44-like n=1 Tax=Chrysoperla carnea TaxID=189513 RepID=UPI001D08F208|nr:endoplasmic reticulum resident protein 44-like [Chrysoperla carnea]
MSNKTGISVACSNKSTNQPNNQPLVDIDNSNVIKITGDNYDQIIESKELVLLLFYTDCHCLCCYSRDVIPIFKEVATLISKKYPNVVLGRINCDEQPKLANNREKFIVGFHPTIKIVQNGKVKHSYFKGERNIENFVRLIEECIKNPEFDLLDTLSWIK